MKCSLHLVSAGLFAAGLTLVAACGGSQPEPDTSPPPPEAGIDPAEAADPDEPGVPPAGEEEALEQPPTGEELDEADAPD